jgi:D-glycero-D-manno-heptose 1,7-bisphosphate phosphatase
LSHKAIFLDRDKTLIEDPGYISTPDAVRLLPGIAPPLVRLSNAGYKLILVTNQSAIARGKVTESGLEKIHAELQRQLQQQGVLLDAIYYCPYHPEGTIPPFNRESDERKPSPGMLLRAAREMNLNLRESWMIGDRLRDVEAGQRAGCRTILVSYDEDPEQASMTVQPDHVAASLEAAAAIVLNLDGGIR